MLFWVQKENGKIELDNLILKEELDRQKYLHSYEEVSLKDSNSLLDIQGKFNYNGIVPVGSLEFVGNFLKRVHSIESMHPIEVPEVLRTEKFLKREYAIKDLSKLPKDGYHFIKYASKLKYFSYTGLISMLMEENSSEDNFLKPGLYVVSEEVQILSEYRCFVQGDKILGINFYNGDCTILPDIDLLKSMVVNYMRDSHRPKAYTMDIAILKDRGTAIIEVHPWVSVGLYGYMFGSGLPYCYRDGLMYYMHENKELTEWEGWA